MTTTESTFQWIAGDGKPWVKWETYREYLANEGLLCLVSEITTMGALTKEISMDGMVLAKNDAGQIVFLSNRGPVDRIKDLKVIYEAGFLGQSAYEAAMGQIAVAEVVRDEGYHQAEVERALKRIRDHTMKPAIARVMQGSKNFEYASTIMSTSSDELKTYADDVKDSLDELLRLRGLSNEEAFTEVKEAEIERIKTKREMAEFRESLTALDELLSDLLATVSFQDLSAYLARNNSTVR